LVFSSAKGAVYRTALSCSFLYQLIEALIGGFASLSQIKKSLFESAKKAYQTMILSTLNLIFYFK